MVNAHNFRSLGPDFGSSWRQNSAHDYMALHYTEPSGVILEGDLGEKVSLSWLTSPYLELREK